MRVLAARLFATCLLLLLLVACDAPGAAPPTPTPIPTATAVPPTDTPRPPPTNTPEPTKVSAADVQKDLQAIVDAEKQAVADGNKEAYMNQVDPGDRDWYHFEQGEFTDNAYIVQSFNCLSNVRLAADGKTAQADVNLDACPGRYHVGVFFRFFSGRWFHSQPALEEQGLRDTKQIGPFRVTYHAMDESYLPQLERFAPKIYERVRTEMGLKQLDVDMDLVSRPTDMPKAAFTTIALYNPMTSRMSVLSPFFWPNGDGTEEALDNQVLTTLTHEFTHRAVHVIAGFAVPHWLNEGMAVYVSQENPTEYVRMVQQLQIVNKLQPPEVLNDLLLDGDSALVGYSEGYSFVQYLTAQEGDPVMPQLLAALRDNGGNLDRALTTVTGKGLKVWWKNWEQSLNN